MDLQNSFTVPADVDTVWNTLLDVQKVAPCMPGATLGSGDAERFEGQVKVKLGPVSMIYGGVATFLERDVTARKAVMEGVGKESRGSGTAKAIVTIQLVDQGPQSTRVDLVTDLAITGKPAQFGRGVMQDVAGRIIDQFAANLATLIEAESNGATSAGETASTATATATAAGAGSSSVAAPTIAKPVVQAADSIDLLGVSAAPMLKRMVPVAVGVIAVAALILSIVALVRT